MTKQQQIKEKVYASCPELKKLSFGCELESGVIVGQWYKPQWKCECFYVAKDFKNMFTMSIGDAKKEIIGHPIHLEHLLKTIETRNGENQFLELNFGTNLGMRMGYGVEKPPTDWVAYNLSKSFDENLENDELVEFLLEILNVK